jgi:tRNA(Ile)-lysidine synthase
VAPHLSDRDLAARLDRLGPFESSPHLAVGVSGGADSLALTLLVDRWARARGGRITALTVDHGLRAGSSEEAAQVGAWLARHGIEHRVLTWTGLKPAAAIQAVARDARRALLAGYCRDHGILHLLLAHQADDQAETILMRVVAGSGPDGMAGMAAIVEQDDVRLLRPLLDVRHEQLVALLREAGQDWIEDPSNRNPRFSRSHLRDNASSPDEALAAASSWGRERQAREQSTAAFLAQVATLHPEGWVSLDLAQLRAAPQDTARRAVLRAVMAVGGLAYPPRGDRLARLLGDMLGPDGETRGRTLGGCVVRVSRGRLLVLREAAAIGEDVLIDASGRHLWDDRFAVSTRGSVPPGARISALGKAGWSALVAVDKSLKSLAIPEAARIALPALWDLDGVLEVYHLLYRRKGADPDSVRVVSAVFRPRQVIAGAGFAALEPSSPSWGDRAVAVADLRFSP